MWSGCDHTNEHGYVRNLELVDRGFSFWKRLLWIYCIGWSRLVDLYYEKEGSVGFERGVWGIIGLDWIGLGA